MNVEPATQKFKLKLWPSTVRLHYPIGWPRGNTTTEGKRQMEKKDVLEIAEGLKLIEEGVEKIQSVMKERKMKSLADIASQLIPIFKADDDSLSDSVIKHLE